MCWGLLQCLCELTLLDRLAELDQPARIAVLDAQLDACGAALDGLIDEVNEVAGVEHVVGHEVDGVRVRRGGVGQAAARCLSAGASWR